ncbi:TlpA family protein disulfide reductase [Treponema sp.]|uniref:TlpA family protein disulfide reductase n=1 Tax=Treponema sp. TaxID=166 RepID=UPI003FA1EE4A
MKVRTILFVFCMVPAVLLSGCSAKQQASESAALNATPAEASSMPNTARQQTAIHSTTAGTVSERLASLGFYIYEEPIDLPLTSVAKLEGGSMNADAFKGKITLLNFWATWCPPCRAEMPSIERLYAQTKNSAFQIVAVNVGERQAQVASFIEKNKYTFPIYLDESQQLSSIFAARGIPSTYIVDKNGKVIAARIGAMEYDQQELIKVFKELADG